MQQFTRANKKAFDPGSRLVSSTSMSLTYSIAHAYARLLMGIGFRTSEFYGVEKIPADRGVIYVTWHPSGLADGGNIFRSSPRPVTFGLKNTLYKMPVIGILIRALGTVPVYRYQDTQDLPEEERRALNRGALTALAQVVADGGCTAMMPEGKSHSGWDLQTPLKKGVARLMIHARQLDPDGTPPAIVPVGLHYRYKWRWRSRTMVVYHDSIDFPSELLRPPGEDEDPPREQLESITSLIQDHLQEAILGAVDEEEEASIRQAVALLQVGEGVPRMKDQMDKRKLVHRVVTQKDSGLRQRLDDYRGQRMATGLRDHEFRGPSRLGTILPLLLFGPILAGLMIPGFLFHLIPGTAIYLISHKPENPKYEISYKVVGGSFVMIAWWLLCAIGIGIAFSGGSWSSGLLIGLAVLVLAPFSGSLLLIFTRPLMRLWRRDRCAALRRRSSGALGDLLVTQDVLRKDLASEVGYQLSS